MCAHARRGAYTHADALDNVVAMRLTVGPLPASVYWRRRAIVLGGTLLIVFLVAQACIAASASPGDGSTATPPPSPPATGSAPDSPAAPVDRTATGDSDTSPAAVDAGRGAAPPAGDAEQCTDDEILVSASASRTEFAVGETVQFEIRIRNDSDRTCRRDIGGDLRELRLNQGTGANKVWSSRDCAAPTGSNEAELPPGHEERYYIAWNGRSTDDCDGDQPHGPLVEPGDYQLFARLGGIHSEPVRLTVR
jgi:hypothetical protein